MDNLRISTITAVGRLFTNNTELKKIYDSIEIDDVFKYVKLNKSEKGINHKKKKKKENKKDFFNQMTFHIYDGVKRNDGCVNLKLFKNGKIQMTGIISKKHGEDIINLIYNKLKGYPDITFVDELKTKIVMVNSDFDYGNTIDRDKLYEYLIDNNYYVTYEPCIYPGVNIKYYYKEGNDTGVCNCSEQCNGQGDGINSCLQVTFLVFNSGKIIIIFRTNGFSNNQIEKAYLFINDTLKKLFEEK